MSRDCTQADGLILDQKWINRETLSKAFESLCELYSSRPALLIKLLKVYLGTEVSKLLTPGGLYVVADFNQLCKIMHENRPHEFIQAVKDSNRFILGLSEKSGYGLAWFASPLFVNEQMIKKALTQIQKDSNIHPQPDFTAFQNRGTLWDSTPSWNSTMELYMYIINKTGCNNIILSGGKTQASQRSESAESPKKQTPLLTVEEKREQVHEFFVKLAQVKEFYQPWMDERLDPVGHGIDEKYQFTMDQTRDILQQLKEVYYKPYFLSQDRFFSMNDEGRRAWFHNMLYMDFSKNRILKRAIADCRRKWKVEDSAAFRKAREESVRSRRASLTPFEWMDEQGNRHYQDAQNGDSLIPADAPGRPNADAFWNEFSHSWEKDNE